MAGLYYMTMVRHEKDFFGPSSSGLSTITNLSKKPIVKYLLTTQVRHNIK